ncbi:hypothetical protein A3C32_04290 [Candidatus Daviesbacteria bacterium RIFCSPHIGHO2_02_FULL_41_14]|uniref:NAD(P)-binding domain-containing protein n=1 Tax=Candidatus Daviesbacteria bacterium RIFCSPLOWO2_01_FULL_40_24 TaxID=1797787 RepID=A0A1F5MJ89_9BACT|nr:MAG: hypothetical protein A3C32_04290 [Candidatus Daviesbacteria bacterium RIFCSPHIGHO2_02_FULL_41_14]OGE65446.1 MAG: hypothetical protein A3B49_00985 [Candidatus Daviesbacteria bacterium RIFCSPLOWO2_01_FULL_40_24]
MKNKVAFVTGAAGFIGSSLVDRLLLEKYYVYGLDNLSKGSLKNLKLAKNNNNFEFIKGAVEDSILIRKLIKNIQPNIIFHLASGNLLTSLQDPIQDLRTTCVGVINILQSQRDYCLTSTLIHSSTGSVYGQPKYQPQDESHPLEPVSPYGISKMAAERYIDLWSNLFGIKAVMLRYYNVYGPRQNFSTTGGVIPIFIDKALRNQPLTIEGTGDQERCFTYVDDVVEANVKAATTPLALGEIFNIGTTEITTIKQLADIVLKTTQSISGISSVPRRLGDIDRFQPNISKASETLGYTPQVFLKEGIQKTVEWFNQIDK